MYISKPWLSKTVLLFCSQNCFCLNCLMSVDAFVKLVFIKLKLKKKTCFVDFSSFVS